MSGERDAPDVGVSEALRQRTVDALCEAFAEDRMSVEEFERRIEAAHKAREAGQLRRLLADLPGRVTATSPGGLESEEGTSGSVTHREGGGTRIARPEEVREHGVLIGVLGGARRKGPWIPARRNLVVGLLGGVTLDLREAIFPPGVTNVHVLALLGGVEIVAPPGVRVEASGMGLLGGFGHDRTVAFAADPDAPVLRITGVACLGGVDVSVRYPGESGREARRRRKEEHRLGDAASGPRRIPGGPEPPGS